MINQRLRDERGMPGVGVCIWREDRSEQLTIRVSVGEFLDDPDRQCGAWLIDGGWGGPPGPIRVRWVNGEWICDGFPPYDRKLRG